MTRRSMERTSPTRPTSGWSTRAASAACRRREGLTRDRRLARSETATGQARRHLPAARLADQPPALLGHADPGHLLRTDGIVPVPDEDLPVLLPDTVDYHGQRREPPEPRPGLPATSPARAAAGRPGARPTRWTRSSTRPGTGSATSRRTRPTAPIDRAPGGPLDARRPVHRRRRARRDAPAVQPLLHQGPGRSRR